MSHPLLTAPIGRSLLLLAGPTTALMLMQILVAVADGIFVGRLGTDALAGMALVIPFVTLMFNIANGGMGGGVAAAVARALGAGRTADAQAIVLHALVLAAAFGAIFAVLDWTCAAQVFGLLGGDGAALERALSYSHVLFMGAVAIWASAFLAALLRGSGDTVTPARVGLLASIAYVPLSGILTLGFADWPGLGVAGSAIATLCVAAATALLQVRAIRAGRLGFVPKWDGVRLQWRIFREILRVGILGSMTTLIASLTAVLMIGFAGRFGVAALAGYGIGARLESVIAPIAFGIGSGLTTLVGVAAGAGAWQRAVRVAWTGGLIAFAAIGLIGWLVALFPEMWSRLFTSDDQVAAASMSYIRHVAPFYCLFGLGVSLNFASQGAGRMMAPLMASFARMVTATIAGWIAVEKADLGLEGLFGAIALGMVVYGCWVAVSLLVRPWREKGRYLRR
ncbi:MAG: MATE family efflux transporter [Bradyrhizobium sp.]|uniref:MATE family efflux transporter n=1 Tax=Bradyrhizobium sp. TaxID=376 RepID=UPI003D141307